MVNKFVNIFNNHFMEFVNDIQSVFPDDRDILTAKNSFIAIRKANPKLISKIWKEFIVKKYENEIMIGDINFFINKDYMSDLSTAENSDKIMDSINRLRGPISQMSVDDQKKTMQYIQNLSKLSKMCD